MDQISLLKGRMAEALVEGIFKRARYTVARVARETQMPALVRIGRAEFVPDFVVWRVLDAPSPGPHSYHLLALEVKYRADLEDYLRRDSPSRSPEVARQWPELYEIVVTDRPEADRSCFQAIHVSSLIEETTPVTVDLHLVPGLDVYRATVEEYEGLVREIFPILGSRSRSEGETARVRRVEAWTGRSERRGHRRLRPAAHPRGYRPSSPSEQRQGVSE
jgi:hypothetical protein